MICGQNSSLCSNSFMEYIGDFLDKEGGILISSIDKLVEIMRATQNKLVPKCMAITVISLSSADVQVKLCDTGVWNILFQWLQEGLKNETTCFILEILRLYLTLPISFENLTSNSCPKLIKKLTKNSNPDIISLSKSIVVKWRKLVEEKTNRDALEVPAKKIKLDESNNSNSDNNNIIKSDTKPNKKASKNTTLRNIADMKDCGEAEAIKAPKKIIKKVDEKSGLEELNAKFNSNADKRRVLEIHESKNFINSLMQTQAPLKKKKKRQELSINKSTSDISLTEETASDTTAKASPLPLTEVIVLAGKQKKRVSWAPPDSLQNIKYFDLDENERVNVLKVSMEELKKKERMIERQNLSHKHNSDDVDDDNQPEKWYKPLKVLGIPENKIDITSVEKTIQFERERKLLKVLYFQRDGIPYSATEPENVSYDVKEPLLIPLEDVQLANKKAVVSKPPPATVANDTVNSKLLIYTEKEGGSECQVTLRPDVASLLKSMTQSSNSTASSQLPSSLDHPNNNNNNNIDTPQTRVKLISIIRARYPDIEPEKLSSEEVCKLLEPMREQLIREGILSMPANQNLSIPPPNFSNAPPQLPWFPGQSMPIVAQQAGMFFPPNGNNNSNNRPFNNNNNNAIVPPQRHMRPVCRFMASNGFCRLGSNCGFSHILQDGHRQANHNRH